MKLAAIAYCRLPICLASIVLACLCGFCGGAASASPASIDVIDWNSAQIDLSFLNKPEQPAGKRGFVSAKGELLVFGDGSVARFWGTNLTAAALFMSDAASVKLHAQRLSRLGFNLVRLHHHDSSWSRPNIFGPAGTGTAGSRKLDPAMVEKIDWWIKCLKEEGIYVWLDLHVGRELRRADGIAGFDEIAKGKDAVDLRGFNYVNDDIEQAMKAFNEAYLGHVNGFTGLAYKDDPAIAAVLITNENDLTHHFGNALLPNQDVPKHSARYMAEASAFAKARQLPEERVWRAWEAGPPKVFLNDLEQRFNARMMAHLRGFGVKVPIVTTSLWGWQMSSLPALTSGDMIDVHAYEEAGFLQRNLATARTTVHTIASAQVPGMPLSVTEWNMGQFPDADRSVLPLYLSASACHQGWDALMHYAYAQKPLQSPAAASNWHAFNDPDRLAMLPAAALLYRQCHVREASTTYVWTPNMAQLFSGRASAPQEAALRIAAERGRLLTSLPKVDALPWLRASSAPAGWINIDALAADPVLSRRAGEVVSDTGELLRDWSKGVFRIDTPRTQAAGGNLAAHAVELSSVTIRMTGPHVSVAVQSLDGEPVARSSNILVSVASMSVPAKGSRLPFLGEPVVGDVEIRADTGLIATEQKGVQIKSEAGRCLVHFDGTAPIHWVRLRRPTQ